MMVLLCDGDGCRAEAKSLVLAAAAAELGVAAGDITLGAEPGGRPVLGGAARGWHVALAHTRQGAVVIGLSREAPLGVDVEPVRDLPVAGLARRWFGEAEQEWLASRPEQDRAVAFLLLWTQKEAVGKALGVGLRGHGLRRTVPLVPDADGPSLVEVPGQPRMRVTAWRHRRDLVLAVAGQGETVTVREFVCRR